MKNIIKFLQYHIQNAPDTLYEISSWIIETEGDSSYNEYIDHCQKKNIDPMSPTLYKECNLGPKPSVNATDEDWHVGDIIY